MSETRKTVQVTNFRGGLTIFNPRVTTRIPSPGVPGVPGVQVGPVAKSLAYLATTGACSIFSGGNAGPSQEQVQATGATPTPGEGSIPAVVDMFGVSADIPPAPDPGLPSATPSSTPDALPPTITSTPDAGVTYPKLETGGVSPGFDVLGVPDTVYVPASGDMVPNNGPDADGNDHTSSLGQLTGVASPGTYYYDGNLAAAEQENPSIANDIRNGVCSVQGSDTRNNFGVDNRQVPINEGTFLEVETAGGEWTIHTPNGDINIDLAAQENHSWMLVVKGLTQDGSTPSDKNISLELNGKDPFSNATMTGKGTFMSQVMVDQIARAMHTAEAGANSSGADGSKSVNMFYVDANTGSWSVFEVQFDAQGNPTGYALVATNSNVQ